MTNTELDTAFKTLLEGMSLEQLQQVEQFIRNKIEG